MKNKRGIAGLPLLLAVVTTLFMIGLVIYVLSLAGGGLIEATSETTSGSLINETISNFTDAGSPLSVEGLNSLQVNDVEVIGCG